MNIEFVSPRDKLPERRISCYVLVENQNDGKGGITYCLFDRGEFKSDAGIFNQKNDFQESVYRMVGWVKHPIDLVGGEN